MSEFDEALQEMGQEILEVFGVEATYTFQDQSTKTLLVRFYKDVEVLDKDGGGISTIEFIVAFSPDDIATAKVGETVTIGSTTYEIGRLLADDGGLNRYEVI